MWQQLIPQLVQVLAPLVIQLVKDYQAEHNGQIPTTEELLARLNSNVARYLGEGAEWQATHPNI